MIKELKLRTKHKVLRYRAGKRGTLNLQVSELGILDFAKDKLRTSEHITVNIADDSIRATKGVFILSMEHGRLLGVDDNSIMDVRVTPELERKIMDYAKKVARYRSVVFEKYCAVQIKKLINGFKD